MNLKRINLTISLPSIALKRFIERALSEEAFFLLALENPLAAFSEAGVAVNEAGFVPGDFARFLGTLGRVRELAAKQGMKDASFESIFGRAPEIIGSRLNAETEFGICWDWGGLQAFRDKQMLASWKKDFGREAHLLREQTAVKDRTGGIRTSARVMAEVRQEMQFVGETTTKSESFYKSNKEWDANDSFSKVRSDTNYNTKFEKQGIVADLLCGPLLHPTELAAVTARIEAFVDLASSSR